MSIKYDGKGLQLPTLAELSKPLAHLDAQHDALEDKISFIESESAKYDHIIANEPDSNAAKNYKAFVEGKNKIAEQLNTQGVLSNNMRKNVLSLNTAFNKNILPIANAYELKRNMSMQEKTALATNSNLRFNRSANDISIDEYIKGVPQNKVLDLNDSINAGMQVGKILSNVHRGVKTDYKKIPGQIQIEQILGYTIEEGLEKGGTIEKIMEDYIGKLKQSYDPELVYKYNDEIDANVKKGVMLSLGQSTKVDFGNDPVWAANKQRQLAAEAYQRSKNLMDYEYSLKYPKPSPNDVLPLPKGAKYSNNLVNINTSKNVEDANQVATLIKSSRVPNYVKGITAGPEYKGNIKLETPEQKETFRIYVNKQLATLGTTKTKTVNGVATTFYEPKLNLTKEQRANFSKLDDQVKRINSNMEVDNNTMLEAYKSKYNVKTVAQLENVLEFTQLMGTHNLGLDIAFDKEYNDALVEQMATQLNTGNFGKVVDATGKSKDIDTYFSIKDGNAKLKDSYTAEIITSIKDGIKMNIYSSGKLKASIKVPEETINPISTKTGKTPWVSAMESYKIFEEKVKNLEPEERNTELPKLIREMQNNINAASTAMTTGATQYVQILDKTAE